MRSSALSLQDRAVSDSVFVIGSVLSIDGRKIVIRVNKDKNLPHLFFNGRTIKNVSVGLSNYVKITKGFTDIICKVESEHIKEDKGESNKKYINERQKINRFLDVSVFGFYDSDGKFQHGIKEMPLIGSECRLLSRSEFERLHQLSGGADLPIPLGSLIDEETQTISVAVNKLFAGHIGIFGNTGSGKSNTLAKMYTELFRLDGLMDDSFEKSEFVVIDFNGEYSKGGEDRILTDNKAVYHLRTRGSSSPKYPIPRSEIEKIELLSILLDATEKTQQPFLHRSIDRDWFLIDNKNNQKEIRDVGARVKDILLKNELGFNKPFLDKFIKDFGRIGFRIISDKNLSKIGYNVVYKSFYFLKDGSDRPDTDDYINASNIDRYFKPGGAGVFDIALPKGMTEIQHIQFKIFSQYYYEVVRGYANQEHINPLINRVQKRFSMLDKVFDVNGSSVPDKDKKVEVISLRDVNVEIKKIIPMLICKANYDRQKQSYNAEQRDSSLHIVIDEAHNILSDASARESSLWKDYRLETFEEIIKEGRKFGVFITIASQRPSDISDTIISQLHNYFIHKLMNDNDLKSINKAVSYLDRLSFDSIPNLSTGCCFVAGQLTQFPLSLKVDLLDEAERPQSGTVDLEGLWSSQNPAATG